MVKIIPSDCRNVPKNTSGTNGYQAQYSASRKFASAKRVAAKKNGAIVGKLKKGGTYYFRVRAYRTISGKKYWGAWSKAKSIKVRK